MMKKGASLLEVVIAIGLISVVLMSLVTLSSKSVSNSNVSKEKNQATRHTQETIEWLRRERDASWSSLDAHVQANSTWCMSQNSWTISGTCNNQPIPNTQFTRQVTFNKPEADVIEVAVVTQWQDSGNTHESRSATILTKWQ